MEICRKHPDPEVRRRAHIMSLLSDGWSWSSIGTTRFMTDTSGDRVDSTVYTAFGGESRAHRGEREWAAIGKADRDVRLRPATCPQRVSRRRTIGGPIDGTQHRYGYAGAWGYQAPSSDDSEDPYLDFPFLHVGTRYYDPATGRFLQRDPIGIGGELNVYAYVGNDPLTTVDSFGLGPKWDKFKKKLKDIVEAIKEAAKYVVPSPVGEMAGAAECIPDLVRIKLEEEKRQHILQDHPDDPDKKDCERCKEIDNILHPPKKGPVTPPPGGSGSPPAG